MLHKKSHTITLSATFDNRQLVMPFVYYPSLTGRTLGRDGNILTWTGCLQTGLHSLQLFSLPGSVCKSAGIEYCAGRLEACKHLMLLKRAIGNKREMCFCKASHFQHITIKTATKHLSITECIHVHTCVYSAKYLTILLIAFIFHWTTVMLLV